jgi:hypothetical protein
VLVADVIYDGTQFVLQNPGVAAGGLASGDIIVADDGAVSAPGITFDGDLDNGLYKIGTNTWGMAAAGAAVWITTAAGEITTPLNPCFLAQTPADTFNVTGDGTVHTIIFSTEITDYNSDYNTGTYTFTAPVTGTYAFTLSVRTNDLASGHDRTLLTGVLSNRNIVLRDFRAYSSAGSTPTNQFGGPFIGDMDAADTCYATFSIAGAAKAVDYSTSFFSGFLIG